jgi:cytochrome c oxidase assembly factor CtaG
MSVALVLGYATHFRGRISRRALSFVAAALLFFLALSSPIGVLARGYLFSAHMLQHLLLTLVIPPLVLLGLPPDLDEHPAASAPRPTLLPWVAGVGAMWIWHAKPLCNAAATHGSIQVVQTASLIAMGLAFWRPVLGPRRAERMTPLKAVPYLFSACVACTILGVIVTLSPVEVCTAYMHPVDELGVLPLLRQGWGLDCKADQELGGLLMWVPTCFVYAGAILATLGKYFGEEARPAAADARGAR